MPLYSYPDSDIENPGGWTTEPLWDKIDEEPFDDEDFAHSPKTATGDSFTVGLSTVADPGVHTGHVVRIRAQAGVSGTFKYELMQGAVVIKDSGDVVLTTSFAEYNMTLSEGEASNITDYTALQVRVTAVATQKNQYQDVSWIRFEVPEVTQDVFLDGTSDAVSSASGDIKRGRKIDGISEAISVVSGDAKVSRKLDSIVNATSSVVGSLKVSKKISGAIDAVSSLTGELTTVGQILLDGISSAISSVVGECKVTRKINAISEALSSLSADLKATRKIDGTVDAISSVSGSLKPTRKVLGATNGISSISADLILAYSLKGTLVAQSALSGNLTVTGEGGSAGCQGMRGDGYFLNL